MPKIVNGKPEWYYVAHSRSKTMPACDAVEDFMRLKYSPQEIDDIERMLKVDTKPLVWINSLSLSEEEGLELLRDAEVEVCASSVNVGNFHLYELGELELEAFGQDPLVSEGNVVMSDASSLVVSLLAAQAALEIARERGYVQSASANDAIGESEGESESDDTNEVLAENEISMLEMCAGEGNMTLPLYAAASEKLRAENASARLFQVACEMNTARFNVLDTKVNAQLAYPIETRHLDARRFREDSKFDIIVLDPPCVEAKSLPLTENDHDALFRQEEVIRTSSLQKSLFLLALSMMKPGSVLLYTTTSLFNVENEEVIRTSLARAASLGEFEVTYFDIPQVPVQFLRTTCENTRLIAPSSYTSTRFIARIVRTS